MNGVTEKGVKKSEQAKKKEKKGEIGGVEEKHSQEQNARKNVPLQFHKNVAPLMIVLLRLSLNQYGVIFVFLLL